MFNTATTTEMPAHQTDQPHPAAAAPAAPEPLLHSVQSAVIAVSAQKRILACNPAAEQLTRLQARNVVHAHSDTLPDPLHRLIEETLAGGPSTNERTLTLFPNTPEETLVHATATRCGDEKQAGPTALLVFQNLTFFQNMESSLRHLDRLASLGTVAAGSAHEVKNALVAIKTFAELSLEKNGDEEMPELVLREIKRIDGILSRILRMAGPARPALKPVGLHGVLEDSLRLVQHRLGALNIHLNRSLLAAHDQVKADEQQLSQAFINLLLNALEAMPRKGSLTVATEVVPAVKNAVQAKGVSTRTQIHLSFTDTGCGISPDNLPRLFNTFFTTKKEGTGLGLAITRRIIQEHGGTITVDSELKKGTTFHIHLPLIEVGA